MDKIITTASSEFLQIYEEISNLAEAKRKREELSDKSFRDWICPLIEKYANALGYYISNLNEFTLDVIYSFKKGFEAGREEARKRSLRYREGK